MLTKILSNKGINVTNNLIDIEKVTFKIFTWGYNPVSAKNQYNKTHAYLDTMFNVGIDIINFSKNFYGYIETK